MAPQRFEIGQEIALKSRPKCVTINGTGKPVQDGLPVPTIGKTYHVSHYQASWTGNGQWFIGLSEFPGPYTYQELAFEPLLTETALTELLEKSLQPQTI